MEINKDTKQILVWRNDLKVRKGKIASQLAHASMAFLTHNAMYGEGVLKVLPAHEHSQAVRHWLQNSFRKIVCYVNSEQELDELHQKCLDKGLVSHMVVDNGATEFNGVKTKTCIAIGPHWDEEFVGITDQLPLL